VIGTPGKVLGWMREKQLDCRHMKILVFDEADQMMDTDGHRVDSLKIMKHLKSSTQVMPQVGRCTFPLSNPRLIRCN